MTRQGWNEESRDGRACAGVTRRPLRQAVRGRAELPWACATVAILVGARMGALGGLDVRHGRRQPRRRFAAERRLCAWARGWPEPRGTTQGSRSKREPPPTQYRARAWRITELGVSNPDSRSTSSCLSTRGPGWEGRRYLLSHKVALAVPSALRRLNFRVRNGIGWIPRAIVTGRNMLSCHWSRGAIKYVAHRDRVDAVSRRIERLAKSRTDD